MLRKLFVLSVLSLTPLLGAGMAHATPPPSPCALRFEGYGGMSVINSEGSSTTNQANAGGTGSGACLYDMFHFQGDVYGDYNGVDKVFGVHTDYFSNVGGGAHFGLADPKVGNIEVTGAYNRLMPDENAGGAGNIWRIGMEGEYYLDAVTLGVSAGYLAGDQNNNDGNGYWARGILRYYPTEDIKLEGLGGVGTIDGDTVPQARVLAEWRPHSWPVGFFLRGEGAWDGDIKQYFATGGIRLYLFDEPATLRETDRRYFRDACTQFLFGARTC